MLKKIGLGLAALVGVLIAVIATRPSTFHIERSVTIAAPAEVVFPLVNDFHQWGGWSPWDGRDPNQQRTFEGPDSGKGAIYGWSGNKEVGKGRMTILESTPNERAHIQLDFIEPWAATNTVTFTLKPAEGGVALTWGMDGNHDFMGKAFALFMDMDAMLGKDFDQGLAGIKKLAEAEAKKRAEAELAARKAAEEEAARKAAEAAAAAEAAPAEGQPAQADAQVP
jgi:uncharacterized protein YndB with AHSA1/START domain